MMFKRLSIRSGFVLGLVCCGLAGADKPVASVASTGYPAAFLTPEMSEERPDLSAVTEHDRAVAVAKIDRARIVRLADGWLEQAPVSLRDWPAPAGSGAGPGDFYSMGDYWWPNPNTANGLPYVQRDGQSNPDNFSEHRLAVRRVRDAVSALAAAYALEGNEAYAEQAVKWLRRFFIEPDQRMNPHLLYAQAIPGVSKGRGIGIIDTLHLAEAPLAIEVLKSARAMTPATLAGLKQWFGEYADWMTSHPNGIQEMNAGNNHCVAYLVQLAAFARLTGDNAKLDLARQRYREIILPAQMARDGSFPAELARTKPYGYSIFQLDNMVLLCQLLSTEQEDLWSFTLADGRGIEKGMAFLFGYLQDRARWPYRHDIQHFEEWPVRQPCLLLAAYAFNRPDYLALWQRLEPDPADPEVQRNMAVTQPVLWLSRAGDVPLLKE